MQRQRLWVHTDGNHLRMSVLQLPLKPLSFHVFDDKHAIVGALLSMVNFLVGDGCTLLVAHYEESRGKEGMRRGLTSSGDRGVFKTENLIGKLRHSSGA